MNVVVVKAGGRLIADPAIRQKILDDILEVSASKRVIFVHGGGDIVTEYSKRMGVEPRFVVSPSGVRSRYTGPEELEVYTMVMAGKLNKELTAYIVSRGIPAIGVSGVDCSLLRAERKKRIIIVNEKGRKQVIPGGFTGRITSVNASCLKELLDLNRIVVISPLAIGSEGELLNVDGDQAAAHVAMALKVRELVFLTDVPGVILEGEILKRILVSEAEAIAEKVGYGMNRKILMAKKAVEEGVGRVIIADGRVEKPVTSALQGHGTVVEGG